MGMTINYQALAAKAPTKRQLRRAQERRQIVQKTLNQNDGKFVPVPQTPYHLSSLLVPPGTKRYYLSVPSGQRSFKQAFDAGCRWDKSIRRWFIDNPAVLSDFIAWKPSLVQAK